MLIYALIGLSLVLTGVAGLQFSYLFYADRLNKERRRHLVDLERKCAALAEQLADAHRRIAEQNDQIAALERGEEVWADVIEER